jgi:hypothetical protein
MENTSPTPQKKGLGALAWVGIGCGGIILIGIIAVVILGAQFKDVFADAAKNPTRATASLMVKTGQFEMAAEDEANKRYTVKEKQTGKLTTIYWDTKTNAPVVIPGDFSAIPSAESAPAPAPEPEPAAK